MIKQAGNIIFRLLVFVIFFTIIFFGTHSVRITHLSGLVDDLGAIPWLFSAISLIFSIISGFVIQSKWQTWNALIDATRGELSSFRQLSIMAHHFPKNVELLIRNQICEYLTLVIDESDRNLDLGTRSDAVDNSLYKLEDIIFNAKQKYPELGGIEFEILSRCMSFREQRLQNNAHRLPLGVRIFVISATGAVIFSSLFIGVKSLVYAYILTLMIGVLAYGVYLLIDDLDHPFRPGDWHLRADGYKELLGIVQKDMAESKK